MLLYNITKCVQAAALSLCFMGCGFMIRCFMYDAERLRCLFLILCPTLDLVGRGARMRETTTRERGSRRCAPVSPSLLRFSLALSFLISHPLCCTPLSLRVFWGFSCLERFRRARPPAYAPDALLSLFILHDSFFTIHFSLYAFFVPQAAVFLPLLPLHFPSFYAIIECTTI